MAFPPDPRPPNARGARKGGINVEGLRYLASKTDDQAAEVGLEAAAVEITRLREALKAIAAADDLVAANEDAFSVHAFRRCQQIADAALDPNSEERP